jgi:CRP-like cAMP-binding protein
VLSRLPLLSQVSPDLLLRLSAAVQRVRLGRGEVLFRQGEPCTGFFVVVRGQIKLAITSAEGNEKVLEIIAPGESFAEAVVFTDRPFPVTATALLAADLLVISRQAIIDLVDSEPLLARRMLAGLSMRLHTMVADVGAMALHSGTERVIGFLLGRLPVGADRHGPGRASAGNAVDGAVGVVRDVEVVRDVGVVRVRLPVGKAVLASRLSLTPETFSRVLRLLTEQGLITVEGRDVVLHDLATLARYRGA